MDSNPKSKYLNVEYEQNSDQNIVINPSLVVFPLNHPKLDELNDETQTNWILCQNRDKKRKDDKLLLGESNKIIFDSKTKMNKNLSDYVIGIFSRKKREMKFVDIDSIFPINQKIRRIEEDALKMEETERQKFVEEMTSGKNEIKNNSGNENNANETSNSTNQNNYIDNKLQLIKDFGTTKAKKAASGIKAHMVNENNISSVNAMKKLLEDNAVKQNLDVQMNEEQQLKNKISTYREILPEFNLEANDKKQIFLLDKIIDHDSMDQLNIELVINMYKDKEIFEANKHRFSEFTHYLFRKFQKSKQGLANVPYKIKSALFLDYLIKFYLLPKSIKFPPEAISKYHDIDIYFVNLFLSKFAESSYHLGDKDKFIKTQKLILKNIYYILILAVMLTEYKFDYSPLARSMKIEEKEIYHYYKEIGCKLSDVQKKGKSKKNNSAAMVELEAPLKLNIEHNKYGNK